MKCKIDLSGCPLHISKQVQEICFIHGKTWRNGGVSYRKIDYIVVYPQRLRVVTESSWNRCPLQAITPDKFIELYKVDSAKQPPDVVPVPYPSNTEQYKIDFNHYADPNSIIDAVLKVCFNKGIRWSNGTSQGLRPEYILISGTHLKSVNRDNFKASTFAQIDAGTYATMNNGKNFVDGKGIIEQAKIPPDRLDALALAAPFITKPDVLGAVPKGFSQCGTMAAYVSLDPHGVETFHKLTFKIPFSISTQSYSGTITKEEHDEIVKPATLKSIIPCPLHPYQRAVVDMVKSGHISPLPLPTPGDVINCRCATIPTGEGKNKIQWGHQHVPKISPSVYVSGAKVKGLEYDKGAVWMDESAAMPLDHNMWIHVDVRKTQSTPGVLNLKDFNAFMENKYKEWQSLHPKIAEQWLKRNTGRGHQRYMQQMGRAMRTKHHNPVTESDAVAINYAASLKATAHVIDATPLNTNPDAPAISFLGEWDFPIKL